MTFTSDERREVAKKMREYDVAEFKESAIVPFLDCLGRGYTDWRGILDELADLIDQPTCRNNGDPDDRYFWCSRCGYEAYTYSDSDCDPGNFSFCPRCGAKVVVDED